MGEEKQDVLQGYREISSITRCRNYGPGSKGISGYEDAHGP